MFLTWQSTLSVVHKDSEWPTFIQVVLSNMFAAMLCKNFLFLSHVGFRIMGKRLCSYLYLSYIKKDFNFVLVLVKLLFFPFNVVIEKYVFHMIGWLLASCCAWHADMHKGKQLTF